MCHLNYQGRGLLEVVTHPRAPRFRLFPPRARIRVRRELARALADGGRWLGFVRDGALDARPSRTAPVRKEAVEGRVMFFLRGTARCLDHAADPVTAWAGDPTRDQDREVLESGPGKARRERPQERPETRRKRGIEHVGSPLRRWRRSAFRSLHRPGGDYFGAQSRGRKSRQRGRRKTSLTGTAKRLVRSSFPRPWVCPT